MVVPQNATYAYVGVFVEELVRSGVRHSVICPGSRSAPLALTLAAHEGIKSWVLVDERSAAFFALGLAKATNAPVVLTCTSGTAAANFLPAVAEASQGRVPLIVLTTDRPPELQGVGAPQTMPQEHLYGVSAKWFLQMAVPEASEMMLRYARTTACRAVVTAQQSPPGPVHLNFPFREPLSNIAIPGQALTIESKRTTGGWVGRPNHKPFTKLPVPSIIWDFEWEDKIAKLTSKYERGLIIAGPGNYRHTAYALLKFAEKCQWPILADPLSSLRHYTSSEIQSDLIIANYDAFLRDTRFVEQARVDVVIITGSTFVSKALAQYLATQSPIETILVDENGDWRDPGLDISQIVPLNLRLGLLRPASQEKFIERKQSKWADLWRRVAIQTHTTLRENVEKFDTLFEGRVFQEIASLPVDEFNLFVGNSMPVRDCDTFFHADAQAIHVYGNRAINGIDGTTSTALGVAVATELPTLLVVGDLTFYHDLNGLLAAKKYNLNLTIIVINNNGGGIFSFLPQASHHADQFEDIFGTPTDLDFAPVVQMYSGTFTRIQTWDEFKQAVLTGLNQGGLHVVEVPTDRAANVQMHRALWGQVSAALSKVTGDR